MVLREALIMVPESCIARDDSGLSDRFSLRRQKVDPLIDLIYTSVVYSSTAILGLQ
jgi:hypothetical protein